MSSNNSFSFDPSQLSQLLSMFGGGSGSLGKTTSSSPSSDFSQYYADPSAFQAPAGYGNITTTGLNPAANAPGPAGIIASLFGGSDSKSSFRPYVDANGNYVWRNPKTNNPVPLATTPGASISPDSTSVKMANQVQSIVNLLPAYSKAIAGQIIPQAQAQLAAQQATSPGLAQLMTQIYGTYAPQLNAIGNYISKQNALAQVGSDTSALQSASQFGGLIDTAQEAARRYDPEYFNTRAQSASRLSDLLSSINLNSELSSNEQREIGQSLAQSGTQRGTYNAPSSLDTVSNAMQYGKAGYNRLSANRSALGDAISNATAALPGFKSGTDVFQVATGKSSTPNAGAQQFTGVNNANTQSITNGLMGLGTNLANNSSAITQTQMNNDTTKQVNKKDWADYLGQVTGSLGGIAGMAACWIARKVYGIDNPKWIKFRSYLLNEAPESLRSIYLSRGEQIAEILDNNQINEIRSLMDSILA